MAKKTRTVLHLSLCDAIPGHGPISDLTFSLAKNGVRNFRLRWRVHISPWTLIDERTGSSGSRVSSCDRLRRDRRVHTLSGTWFEIVCMWTISKSRHVQRDLPIRVKRKVNPVGGIRGMWSLPIRQSLKTNGVSYERVANPYEVENDTVLVSTDANPSPGLSRVRPI